MKARCTLALALVHAFMSGAVQAAQAANPATVSGHVYQDANGNGSFDPGEKGIPGVRVTDGVGFATSGADGTYTIRIGHDPDLPLRPAQTLGVCWPSGLWPAGPWWIRLSRIADAGTVDFALRTDLQTLPFVYLHMTDAHEFFNTAHLDFAEFVNALPQDVKFIIDTGDSFRPKSAEEPFKRLFFSTVGNHDTWELPDPPPEGRYAAWTDRLGPLRWSFDHAGIHFVGVDVIDENKSETMIDWLEKDLAALPAGTRVVLNYHFPDLSGTPRFIRLLRDYPIEVVHAGHDHAYGWSDGTPSLVRAYHWQPPGTCNLALVSKDRIQIGVYCIGCKKSPGRHSRRCPMEWIDHVLLGSVRPLFSRLHTLAPGPLEGTRTVKLSDPHTYILAKIDPADAKRVALKIGTNNPPLEIASAGGRLTIDGTSVPLAMRPGQKTLDLTVFAHHNILTVWANNYFFMEKPVTFTQAGEVSITADGGAALIESMTVQEVKADPSNKNSSYFCGCGHGHLRRVP